MDDIVFIDNDYAIVRFASPFSTGFNVYRLDDGGREPPLCKGTKVNDRYSWFKTAEAAAKWLKAYRSEATH